ncbi:hypothetical protein [Streptomyces sp. cmx-18-6]|uniref:hypothetical protein n=1 Tax=Streptomyces sp. cmx-18-6 TaxID=2790930 RepID=UPI0039809D7B
MFVRPSAKSSGATAAPSLRDRVMRVGRASRAGAFVVLALLALTLAVPGTAHAGFSCDFTGDDSYQMDSPGSNGESIMPAVNQWEGKADRAKNLNDTTGLVTGAVRMPKSPDQYTLYELNGMRGMNWSMTFKGKGDASESNGDVGSGADDCAIMDYVNNGIADMVFNGTKLLTRTAISIKESASNPSPLSGLYESRDSVVKTLKDNVFVPAVPVMIALTGLWVFTKWRKGEMREVWAGVGWAGLTTVAVVALLTGGNYDKLVTEADSGIAQFNSRLTEAVLSGATGEMQTPCDLPDTAYNRGLRISSCAMYDTLAFRPWALGQFGEVGTRCILLNHVGKVPEDGNEDESAKSARCRSDYTTTECHYGKGVRCDDLRAKQAVAQSMTNKEALSKQALEDGNFDKFNNEWEDIRKEIAVGEDAPDKSIYPVAFNDWSGKNSGTRVGLAFYSLIASLIVGLMVIVLSALTLLWHAVTLILIILLPLVATLGIHPSQQKLLKGWLETFIHSFVLRAGFGIILTVLLVLYQMILPANIALGMQLLLLLLITIAVVMMLKKLLGGNFSPKIAGAQDSLGVSDMANIVGGKMAERGSRAAVGVAAGASGSAGTAGRVAGRGAANVGRGLDAKVLKGRLQNGGWIGPANPKRKQRKSAQQAAAIQQDQYNKLVGGEQPATESQPDAATEKAEPPRRSGRVSAAAPAPAPSVPGQPQPAPHVSPGAQQPSPQPQAQPQPQPRPRQTQVQPQAQPQPQPLTPQQPPQPPPPRNDHRMPR